MNYKRIYEYRFSDIDQDSRNRVWNEISRFVHPLMGAPVKILEPGGGRCEFISSITSAKERWVVDKMMPDAGLMTDIKFVHGDIFSVNLPSAYFDGIFVSNFLEHLGSHDEIIILLSKLRDCLQDSGIIAIMGPNFKYAFKEYYDCSDHRIALTHLSVEELLYSAGFQIEKIIPRFIPFSFRGKFPPNAILTRIYLHIPLMWKLFGKQYLIIGRKCTS